MKHLAIVRPTLFKLQDLVITRRSSQLPPVEEADVMTIVVEHLTFPLCCNLWEEATTSVLFKAILPGL